MGNKENGGCVSRAPTIFQNNAQRLPRALDRYFARKVLHAAFNADTTFLARF
jgi:hypothetical protein